MINAGKSKIVQFRKKGASPISKRFCVGEVKIEQVKSYKYLGVIMDEFLSFEECVTELEGSGSRALGSIIGKTKDNYDLGHLSFRKLFESCVSPILDYSSGVWSLGKDHQKLDNIQLRAIRLYCGIPCNAPIAGLLSEMCWTSGMVRRDVETVQLYNQLIQMDTTRLNCRVFEYEWNKSITGGWSANLHKIAESIDLLHLLIEKKPIPLNSAKNRLTDMYNAAVETAIE